MAEAEVTFDEYVLSLQSWSVPEGRVAEYQAYLDDERHTWWLLRAIDDGLELPPLAVTELPKRGLMTTIGATHFREQQWFNDDARFTSTRFAMVFEYHKMSLMLEQTVWAASAQLDRMLRAGRMSPDVTYLWGYHDQVNALVAGGSDWRLWVPLVAHYDDEWDMMVRRSHAARDRAAVTGVSGDEVAERLTWEAQQVLAAAPEFKDEMFREYWLRAAVSQAEWGAVHMLASDVLRELYADVWSEGYAGYHRRLAV